MYGYFSSSTQLLMLWKYFFQLFFGMFDRIWYPVSAFSRQSLYIFAICFRYRPQIAKIPGLQLLTRNTYEYLSPGRFRQPFQHIFYLYAVPTILVSDDHKSCVRLAPCFLFMRDRSFQITFSTMWNRSKCYSFRKNLRQNDIQHPFHRSFFQQEYQRHSATSSAKSP